MIPKNQEKDTRSRDKLMSEQNKDPDIVQFSKRALFQEAANVGECFHIKDGIFMRKWRPPEAPPSEGF
jgi:hypothetical protein